MDKKYRQIDKTIAVNIKPDLEKVLKRLYDYWPVDISIHHMENYTCTSGYEIAKWNVVLSNRGVDNSDPMNIIFESKVFLNNEPVMPSLLDILRALYDIIPREDSFENWCIMTGEECNVTTNFSLYEVYLGLSKEFERVFGPNFTIDNFKRFLPPIDSKLYLYNQKQRIEI